MVRERDRLLCSGEENNLKGVNNAFYRSQHMERNRREKEGNPDRQGHGYRVRGHRLSEAGGPHNHPRSAQGELGGQRGTAFEKVSLNFFDIRASADPDTRSSGSQDISKKNQ